MEITYEPYPKYKVCPSNGFFAVDAILLAFGLDGSRNENEKLGQQRLVTVVIDVASSSRSGMMRLTITDFSKTLDLLREMLLLGVDADSAYTSSAVNVVDERSIDSLTHVVVTRVTGHLSEGMRAVRAVAEPCHLAPQ